MGATLTTAGGTVAASSVGAWTAGLGVLSGAGGFGAAALGAAAVGGAVGNIAGQGVAIASGLQDGFQWRQVGQAALGSAITAGIGSAAQAGGTLSALNGSQAWQAAGRAALSSGANQALRGHWSWREIVASAVGGGAGAAAGNALNGSAIGNAMGSVGQRLAAGFAGGVAGQWAGPGGKANYGSVFASTLGSVIGDSIVGGMASDRNLSNSNYRNEMDRESDAYSPVFNSNYRNGSDVESDLAYDARRAQEGAEQSDAILARRANEAWAASQARDRSARDQALAMSNFEAAAGRVWAQEDAQADLNARAALRQQHENAEAYRQAQRAGDPGLMGPVWSFREVSMAQRKLDDAQALRDYQASIANGPSVRAYDPSADQARQAQRQALLNFLNGQGSMALGGVVSAGVMLGTNNVQAASAVSDALEPIDSLLAPMGGGAGLRLGRVRGSRPIDLAKTYEADVRRIYADMPIQSREFRVRIDGQQVRGVADNVAEINGNLVAIEAKYVDNWAASLRNPASPEGGRPWAVAEQQKMIDQAVKYSRGFDQVIYHTNSPELANHYSPLFRRAGVNNFEFMITPAKTKD